MSDIAVTGGTLVALLGGFLLLVIGLIFLIKGKFKSSGNSDLREAYANQPNQSPLNRTKYPQVDAFSMSGTFFNTGLLIALAITILAFSWTTYEDVVIIPEGALEMDDDIEVEPPRTAEPPPPPPPPPPPVIEEVPEEEIEEEEEIEFVDQSVEEETVVEAPPAPEPVEEAPPPPPPPPPPPAPEVEEIFTVVEEMPRFPGCEDKPKAERKACADQKMLQFIYKNIKYPAIARENGVEGSVVIRFYIDKDGSVKEPQILKDIGAGTGSEAMRVVNMMNGMSEKWTPGKQRGKPVKVYFNLPVKFRLE